MIGPARRAAVSALATIREGRAALPDVLAALRDELADPRDVALASEIVIGTQRWRATLDYLVGKLSSRPIARLDGPVLDILRAAAYQLVHLDRVPASAVVNDAVGLAKAAGHAPASGFVNALLRRLASPATRPQLPTGPSRADRDRVIDYLALVWSHPRWLVARWYDRLGREAAEARLRHDQTPACTTLRVPVTQRDRVAASLAEAGVVTQVARFAPSAVRVVSGNPWRSPLVPGRDFVVQDEASQLVAHFAGPVPGNLVLDVCAAPGGKATLMAELMGDAGLVVAGDVREARVNLLRQAVADSGATRVRVVGHDGLGGLPYGPAFDLVLVDAPCTGLGTLRRDPDLKWRRHEKDIARLAAGERALLAEAARTVRHGGRLVYATCSSEPEENEMVVRSFLDAHASFRPAGPPTAWAEPPLAALVTPGGWLQTLPERDGLDAFFAAAFSRAPA